ncbi:MAG: hypothetical protein RMN25_02085 [Anaerolineae bacterium]|nr:hypothetical protein [Thermoflexales bacterium]MDW8406545.1 hypothetical protein [Anaerolineae bacterium]
MSQHATPSLALPDVLSDGHGGRITTPAEWWAHRPRLLAAIEIEYGALPPASSTTGVLLHSHPLSRLNEAIHAQYRLSAGPDGSLTFLLDVLRPSGEGRAWPVLLTGDGCWGFVSDDIAAEVLARGYVLAQFIRTEIVPDVYHTHAERTLGLYRAYPNGDYGALAAWAWGYHRCIDFLSTLPYVDAARIAVTGHSRGGKAALLAGATDERIALTAPNNSGCGGAGCFRIRGPGSETLKDIVTCFPHWFSPRLQAYIDREQELPFDQHFVKALVAPRPLLSTEALGDLWANPSGTFQTHRAAREVYRLLGHEHRIGIWYRAGGHEHGLADWRALLDFADWQLLGRSPARRFDVNPFDGA